MIINTLEKTKNLSNYPLLSLIILPRLEARGER